MVTAAILERTSAITSIFAALRDTQTKLYWGVSDEVVMDWAGRQYVLKRQVRPARPFNNL